MSRPLRSSSPMRATVSRRPFGSNGASMLIRTALLRWSSGRRPDRSVSIAVRLSVAQVTQRRAEDGAAMAGGPLDGVTVVDVSTLGPGPFASMMLADFGADVIEIRRPGPVEVDAADQFVRGKQ